MQKSEATHDNTRAAMFSVAYAEAKRLILEHNDVNAAMRCLNTVTPECKSHLWCWTDLMAALLFKEGLYCECYRVLTSYDSRHPGDPRVASIIEMLRSRCPEIGIQPSHP